MTFREFLCSEYVQEHDTFDMIIGDVDMPASVVWDGSLHVTPYCEEKFGCILDSNIEIYESPFSMYSPSVEITNISISAELGKEFVCSLAGYCDENEYNKLFDPD